MNTMSPEATVLSEAIDLTVRLVADCADRVAAEVDQKELVAIALGVLEDLLARPAMTELEQVDPERCDGLRRLAARAHTGQLPLPSQSQIADAVEAQLYVAAYRVRRRVAKRN